MGFLPSMNFLPPMRCACLRFGFVCLGVKESSRVLESGCLSEYDHKSSIRNLISMWLHVEKNPCHMLIAQDLEY